MACVYKVTNKTNGKSYIGQSKLSLRKRRMRHESAARKGKDTVFCRALRKHGLDNFEWIILHDNVPENELSDLEIQCIEDHGTLLPNGYNMTTGGENGIVCDYTRDKISKTVKSQWDDPEHRAKKIEGLNSPEAKRLMSEASNRRWSDEEQRKIAALPYEEKYGEERAKEIKKKQSETLKGHVKSEEALKNISESAKNRSPEAMKNSISGLKEYNKKRAEEGISEETRQKMKEAHKGKKLSEETKKKMRIAQQKRRQKEKMETTLPS